MRRRRTTLGGVGVCCVVILSPAVAAEPDEPAPSSSWMSEEAMRSTFGDKTIQGLYSDGRAFVETYKADGSIAYSEKNYAYQGHWSLQAGTFCTIYHSDPTGGCYQVRQVSSNCYEFYFVARTEEEALELGPGAPKWTARAAVSDRDATCSDKPTV